MYYCICVTKSETPNHVKLNKYYYYLFYVIFTLCLSMYKIMEVALFLQYDMLASP